MLTKTILSNAQNRYFASTAKIIAEGILLGSSGAFFLPETFQLNKPISPDRYITMLLIGLIFLIFGAILEQRGQNARSK